MQVYHLHNILNLVTAKAKCTLENSAQPTSTIGELLVNYTLAAVSAHTHKIIA